MQHDVLCCECGRAKSPVFLKSLTSGTIPIQCDLKWHHYTGKKTNKQKQTITLSVQVWSWWLSSLPFSMTDSILQSCPAVCNTLDYSQPGSSFHGIFQAGMLEWIAFPPPGDAPDPRIKAASPVAPVLQAGSLPAERSEKGVKRKVTQLWLTLCDPMDSTVHRILQVRILGMVDIPFSRGSSQPRDWTQVSRIASRFFTIWATRETPTI